jgi:hypothetical protein
MMTVTGQRWSAGHYCNAILVLEVLVDDRPGDIALAWTALEALGPTVRKPIQRGLAAADAHARGLRKRVREAAGM